MNRLETQKISTSNVTANTKLYKNPNSPTPVNAQTCIPLMTNELKFEMLKLKVIAAACDDMGIGFNNTLPWKLKNEMKHFETMTTYVETNGKQNAVIMGRKTWESIPIKYRPLKGRFNIVLSRQTGIDFPGATLVAESLEDAIKRLEEPAFENNLESGWIIGGEQIYKVAMDCTRCERIYLTRIKTHYECDTFFPPIPLDKFELIRDPSVSDEVQCENGIEYKYEIYQRL